MFTKSRISLNRGSLNRVSGVHFFLVGLEKAMGQRNMQNAFKNLHIWWFKNICEQSTLVFYTKRGSEKLKLYIQERARVESSDWVKKDHIVGFTLLVLLLGKELPKFSYKTNNLFFPLDDHSTLTLRF